MKEIKTFINIGDIIRIFYFDSEMIVRVDEIKIVQIITDNIFSQAKLRFTLDYGYFDYIGKTCMTLDSSEFLYLEHSSEENYQKQINTDKENYEN